MRATAGSIAIVLGMLTATSVQAKDAYIAQARAMFANDAFTSFSTGSFSPSMLASPLALSAVAKPAAQTGPNGPPNGLTNVSSITQSGVNNLAVVSQIGGGNQSTIVQRGTGNQAIVMQRH